MDSSGSPGDLHSFYSTRRDSAAMVVDAPMTPPTSPLPPDLNSEQQQSTYLHDPVASSPNDPSIASQVSSQQVSLDQIMRLQQLRLNQDRNRDEGGTSSRADEDWESTETTRMPQRSLEDEEVHVQGSGGYKLTDFDVVETLGLISLLVARDIVRLICRQVRARSVVFCS